MQFMPGNQLKKPTVFLSKARLRCAVEKPGKHIRYIRTEDIQGKTQTDRLFRS